jgi:hypothetical protein
MQSDNLFVSIKEMLDFIRDGPGNDEYYHDKYSATVRRLKFHIKQVECDELRQIIVRKARESQNASKYRT